MYAPDDTNYRPTIPRRASATYDYTSPSSATTEVQPRRIRRPFKRYLLLGVLLMLCGYLFFTTIVRPFVDALEQQWHYGDTPVFSLDADVGHGGVSHFLSMVWQGEILVIEATSKDIHLYRCSSLIADTGKTPLIVMNIMDVNNDGKPDLLVHLAGQSASVALLNNGTSFVLQGA